MHPFNLLRIFWFGAALRAAPNQKNIPKISNARLSPLLLWMGLTLFQRPILATPVQSALSGPMLRASADQQSGYPFLFNDPPVPRELDDEPDNRRDGGGSRPGHPCEQPPAALPSLTALVPQYEQYNGVEASLVFGTTLAEYPTFWFYVPYSPPFTATFTLWDRQGRMVHEGTVRLPDQPGIIQLSLPATLPALAPGTYHWYFKINCDSAMVSYVDGFIQTLASTPTLSRQLENATPQEQVALYGENGLWYDAIATAATLQHLDPTDPTWVTLLEAVGLEAIAPLPRVNCCQWESSSEPASN